MADTTYQEIETFIKRMSKEACRLMDLVRPRFRQAIWVANALLSSYVDPMDAAQKAWFLITADQTLRDVNNIVDRVTGHTTAILSYINHVQSMFIHLRVGQNSDEVKENQRLLQIHHDFEPTAAELDRLMLEILMRRNSYVGFWEQHMQIPAQRHYRWPESCVAGYRPIVAPVRQYQEPLLTGPTGIKPPQPPFDVIFTGLGVEQQRPSVQDERVHEDDDIATLISNWNEAIIDDAERR